MVFISHNSQKKSFVWFFVLFFLVFHDGGGHTAKHFLGTNIFIHTIIGLNSIYAAGFDVVAFLGNFGAFINTKSDVFFEN